METSRCVIPRPGEVVFERITLPDVAPGEVRVGTWYTLISPGTELAMFQGTHIGIPNPANSFAKYPFAPGYAAVGQIVETGAAVSQWTRGELVYFHGKHQAVQSVDPARQVLLAVPPALDPKEVPFARLAQIANTALVAAEGGDWSRVAVIGLGLVGNLAAQLFRRAGATVYAFDTLAERCEWARACGIAHAVHVAGSLQAAVLDAAEGRVPLAIEATGVGALAETCLRIVADRGTVVLLGSPRDAVTLDIYDLIHRPGARLVGAHERLVPLLSESGHDQRSVARDMLGAIATGELMIAPLLSRIGRPDALGALYDELAHRKQNVVGALLDWKQGGAGLDPPSR